MAYKTKFRDIEFPKNGEELMAIGYDANSLRSFGAACYRHICKNYTGETPRMLKILFEKAPEIPAAFDMIENPERDRKQIIYMAEGAKRAAKKKGHESSVKYLSRFLEKFN